MNSHGTPFNAAGVDTGPHAGSPRTTSSATGPVSANPSIPMIALEVACCDECSDPFVESMLWPVIGYGRVCEGCVDNLRDQGLAS